MTSEETIARAIYDLRDAWAELGEEEFTRLVAQRLKKVRPGMGYLATLRACVKADELNQQEMVA